MEQSHFIKCESEWPADCVLPSTDNKLAVVKVELHDAFVDEADASFVKEEHQIEDLKKETHDGFTDSSHDVENGGAVERLAQESRPFLCSVCGNTFSSLFDVQKHEETHTVRTFASSVCRNGGVLATHTHSMKQQVNPINIVEFAMSYFRKKGVSSSGNITTEEKELGQFLIELIENSYTAVDPNEG